MAHVKNKFGGLAYPLMGQAGVYAVASKVALLGHNVLFPVVDEGYDLMLGNGLKVQVKCAHLMFYSKKKDHAGCYTFDLRRQIYDRDGEHRNSPRKFRRYESAADFFVLWAIEENRFFVVPTSIKNQRIDFSRKDGVSIHINDGLRRKWQQVAKEKEDAFEGRWDLLEVSGIRKLIESAAIETLAAQKEN